MTGACCNWPTLLNKPPTFGSSGLPWLELLVSKNGKRALDEQTAYLLYSLHHSFWGAGMVDYRLGEAARNWPRPACSVRSDNTTTAGLGQRHSVVWAKFSR